MFFLAFIGCSEDETEYSEINGGLIYTSQLVTIARDNLTQEVYTGVLNGEMINLTNTFSGELIFFAFPEIVNLEDDNILEIPDLNLKIKYSVKQTSLLLSAEETLQPWIDQISNTDISGVSQGENLQQFIDNFMQYFSSLSPQQMTAMAEYYKANQELFDSALSVEDRNMNSDSDWQEATVACTECNSAVYRTVIFGSAAIILGDITLASGGFTAAMTGTGSLSFGVAGIMSFVAVLKTCEKFQNIPIKKISQFTLSDLVSESSNYRNLNDLQFTSNVSKSVTAKNGARKLQNSDMSDTNSYISSFFSSVAKINDVVVGKINAAISMYNENIPSFLSPVQPIIGITIPDSQPINIEILSQNIYENLTFSVENDNVSIGSVSFAGGNISLTLIIDDPTQITGESISTHLKYRYNDTFSKVEGSFPITITNEEDLLAGTWVMTHFHSIFPVGQYDFTYYSECPSIWQWKTTYSGSANFSSGTGSLNHWKQVIVSGAYCTSTGYNPTEYSNEESSTSLTYTKDGSTYTIHIPGDPPSDVVFLDENRIKIWDDFIYVRQ